VATAWQAFEIIALSNLLEGIRNGCGRAKNPRTNLLVCEPYALVGWNLRALSWSQLFLDASIRVNRP